MISCSLFDESNVTLIAGKPDALRNCTIVNQTANSLHVECTEGFDGGLAQEFVMEVYDAVSQNLVSNVTMKTASFTVSGLRSGFGFDVSLYAANAKGQSDPVSLQAATLKAAAKRTGESRYISNNLLNTLTFLKNLRIFLNFTINAHGKNRNF